jgi:hypothetical protein
MTRPQTVVKEQYVPEEVTFDRTWNDQPLKFTIHGMTPDRTYEDRDVYFESNCTGMSMRAEDAITLGTKLIEHGRRAMLANMYQHQHIHHVNQLKRFIREERVEKLIFTVTDEHPANHGSGWRLHTVTPVWVEGKAPRYNEDFEFETIVYWSPFKKEFEHQLAEWKVPVEIANYDREQDVANFQKAVEEFSETQKTYDLNGRLEEIEAELLSGETHEKDSVEDQCCACDNCQCEAKTEEAAHTPNIGHYSLDDDLNNLIKLEAFRTDFKKGLDNITSMLVDNAFIALLQESAVAHLDPELIVTTLEVNKLLSSKLNFVVTDRPLYEGHTIPEGYLFNTSIPFPENPYNVESLESLFEKVTDSLANHLSGNVKDNETLVLYNITCEKVYTGPSQHPKVNLVIRGFVKTKDSFRNLSPKRSYVRG